MKKRITSLLLVLCMVIAMLPTFTINIAFAAETDADAEWEYEAYGDGVVLTKYLGSAADVYIPYAIEAADGTLLTVLKLGDGAFKNNTGINSATFGEGITEIGASAFEGATNLVCIVTPESLTTIGAKAFSGCINFNSVILYDAVRNIGENAFLNCSSLTIYCNNASKAHAYVQQNDLQFQLLNSGTAQTYTQDGITYSIADGCAIVASCNSSQSGKVVIPSSINGVAVTTISSSAFKNCSYITEISIPESVRKIGSYAFNNCTRLQKINIPNSIKSIEEYTFINCYSLIDIQFGTSLSQIYQHAFQNCSSLASVTLPSSIRTIYYCAFADCTSLKNINLDNVVSIGGAAFYGCNALEYVYLPRVNSLGAGPTTLECFAYNTVIGSNNYYVKSYAATYDYMFFQTSDVAQTIAHQQCDGTVYVNIDNEIRILSYDFGTQTDVVLPNEIDGAPVVEIRANALKSLANVKTLRIYSCVTKMPDDYKELFVSKNADIIFVVSADSYAYNYVASIGDKICITDDDKEPNIQYGTFGEYLEYTIINDNVIITGSGSTKPNEFTVPYRINGVAITNYEYGVITSLTGFVELEEGFKTFYKNLSPTNAKYVFIPKSIEQIEDNALYKDVLYGCYPNTYTAKYLSENGYNYVLIEEGTEPYLYTENNICYLIFDDECAVVEPTNSVMNKAIVIPEKIKNTIVKYVLGKAFAYKYIGSITFPDTIEFIGSTAFIYNHITSLKLPSNIHYLGESAFESCHSLSKITIPGTIKTLREDVFNSCDSVSEVVIQEGVEVIEDSAFGYYTGTTVTIPESVKIIHNYAFRGCENLLILCPGGSVAETFAQQNEYIYVSDVKDPSTIVAGYYGNIYVIGSDGVATVTGSKSISGTITVPEMVDGNKITSISSDAFRGNTRVTKVVLPDTLTELPENLFYECSSLTQVVLPSKITEIPRYAFSDCTSLGELILPSGIKTIGENAFADTSSSLKLVLNEGLEEIGEAAFARSDIKEIHFPDSLKKIGDMAFYYCDKLTGVKFNNNLETVGDGAFTYCYSITEIELGGNLSYLGDSAFQGCNRLKTARFTGTLSEVMDRAFISCSNLETVILNENVKKIGWYTFSGCTNLRNIDTSYITFIDDSAFKDCISLGNIYLSEKATYFGYYKDCFASCKNLLICCYKDSYAHKFAANQSIAYYLLDKEGNPEIAFGTNIMGTVKYTDASPASGATVEILYDDGTIKESVTTDANGNYEFTYAEAGRYTIQVTDAGGNTASEIVSVKRMNAFDVFLAGETDIKIKAAYTVSGNVSPTTATVTLTDSDGNVIETVNSTDGTYTFNNVPNGSYIIKAETESGSAVKEIVVFNGDVTGADITVAENAATITGDVEVEDRDKNRHKRVWVEVTLYNEDGVALASTKTGENGEYTFKGIPTGEYALVAETNEMRPDKKRGHDKSHKLTGYAYVTVTDASTYEVDTIILTEENDYLAEISGKVTAHGETQDCEVVLRNVFRHEVAKCNTGKNGKYTFKNVRDGLYFITARTNSDGMGFAVVLVRDGKVYGETDITVAKPDKIKNRENDFPSFDDKAHAKNNRARIAEEKRWYDSLSEKEKKHCSKEYVERLNKYCEWISDCEYENSGGTLSNGGMILSEEELKDEKAYTLTLSITESAATEIGEDGIKTDKQFIQQSIEDTAGDKTIVKYYNITLTKKDSDGKSHEIKSIARDTDTTGRVRITMEIPEEHRGRKHYHFVHVHNGVPTTLTDLDDDPDTITFEVDRFSTFALTYTDEELAIDGEVEEENVVATNFGEVNAYIRNISYTDDSGATRYRIILLAAIDGLNYREVGFEITANGKTRSDGTKTVYSSVKANNSDGNVITVTPSKFGGNSAYIFAQKYTFSESYKDAVVTFRPYAIDFSGNYIYGKETTIDAIYNK